LFFNCLMEYHVVFIGVCVIWLHGYFILLNLNDE